MNVKASEIKRGNIIILDGDKYRVADAMSYTDNQTLILMTNINDGERKVATPPNGTLIEVVK